MNSWFDLPEIPVTPESPDAQSAYLAAIAAAHRLIDAEVARGTPASRVAIGGFSQGGALALGAALSYPKTLAGAVVFSGWAAMVSTLSERVSPANAATPVIWCHGLSDEVVVPENARDAGAPALAKLNVPVQLRLCVAYYVFVFISPSGRAL